jgi:SAM-dependent methyltransferase
MTPDEGWLASMWPFVLGQLPVAPATVLEIGCGPLGGFVPEMRRHGYDAAGVDPEAPDEPGYHRLEFERHDLTRLVDAVVACTSLHHVDDVGHVLDRVVAALKPGGVLVVVEWAWELFDETTARWCFDRLAAPTSGREPGWLDEHRQRWTDSGEPWRDYFRSWTEQERLQTGQQILQGVDARFERERCSHGPYFFADLDGTTEADEQAAMDAGQISATGIRYTARRRAFSVG